MCNIAEAAQEESAALRETADMLRQHAAKFAKQAATAKAELAALRSQASCNSKSTKHIVIQHVLYHASVAASRCVMLRREHKRTGREASLLIPFGQETEMKKERRRCYHPCGSPAGQRPCLYAKRHTLNSANSRTLRALHVTSFYICLVRALACCPQVPASDAAAARELAAARAAAADNAAMKQQLAKLTQDAEALQAELMSAVSSR